MGMFLGPSSNPLIRRDLLCDVGNYDEALYVHEDKQLFLALAERCDFGVVRECLVGYRQWGSSLSHDLGAIVSYDDVVRQDARNRHPELPERLFRWAEANFLWWLASRQWHDGRKVEIARTVARLLRTDPGFILRSTMLRMPISLARRLLGLHRTGGHIAGPFLGTASNPHMTTPLNAFDLWRDRRIATFKVNRVAMGHGPARSAQIAAE
jgi:hypothetical protein